MTSTSEAPTRLVDELADAERAAAGPRQQVATLESALQTAIAGGQFDQASVLQGELEIAREAHALADARADALRGAATRLDRERSAGARKLAEAQERDAANRDLVGAQGDAAQAASRMNAAIAAMREDLTSARRNLRIAETFQEQITAARSREKNAKGRLGYWPAHHPGPAVAAAKTVSALVETDPLIKALTRANP